MTCGVFIGHGTLSTALRAPNLKTMAN